MSLNSGLITIIISKGLDSNGDENVVMIVVKMRRQDSQLHCHI